MTTTMAAEAGRAAGDRLGAWCGWVMVGAAGLVPLIGWLSPLGFAPLLALMGLLCLPAVRLADEDRPALIVLLLALIWAAASMTWSAPQRADGGAVLQLALALPLFWSAVCGARRADPRLNGLALAVLTWGLAAFGAVLLVEVFTDAALYRMLHDAVSDGPIRPDLARSKDAHATFVLAVLWPAVVVGAMRRLRQLGALVLAVTGLTAAAHVFLSDAPILAFPLSASAMLLVWLWPRFGPRLLALCVAAVGFGMPGLVWLLRQNVELGRMEQGMETSWSSRLSYWGHALDGILERPWLGWGLEGSRHMPGMQLHPHNSALQVWLELGMVGAAAAAAFWGLTLIRLARDEPDIAMSAVAGSTAAYVLFAWINFGMWQQWWLALGALIAVLCAMLSNRAERRKST